MANPLIQKYCKTASKFGVRREDKGPRYLKFCIASLKENPDSQNAKNTDELIVIGVENAMSNMTNVKGIVEKILKERRYKSKLSEKLLRDCLKLYSTGSESLIQVLKYIKLRERENAIHTMITAKLAPRSCEMKFNGDNEQISPVEKENDVLFDVVEIPQLFMIYSHKH